LTLRATEGFAHALCDLLKVELPIPDYSTVDDAEVAGALLEQTPNEAK